MKFIYAFIDSFLRVAFRWLPLNSITEQMALWWGYRFRPQPQVITLRSGALIKITHIDHLQLLLYYFGTFEPKSLHAMRQAIKPGDMVLDVGANIGLFTVEAANRVGRSGHVISVEAAPIHAQTVREAAATNHFDNIEVLPFAVGESDGEAILTMPQDANFGMFTLGKVEGDQEFLVPVRRLDDLAGDRKIDFIKMDIEGSEYRALKGAEISFQSFIRPS